ncbi:unnamed protein product [Sphagnum jensenii]|uniref:HVA22-like protein n=1 Tax=Sphagnum jensenii TaxID=128206 RepID=A0ABP1A5I7_9BRYO
MITAPLEESRKKMRMDAHFQLRASRASSSFLDPTTQQKRIIIVIAVTKTSERESELVRRRSMGDWILALAVRASILAGPVITLLYPLYASIQAIESPSKEDEQQWLTYWVLYSFITLFEVAAAPVLFWIPFWGTIKLAVTAWLVLPQFRGGEFVYEQFVRPYIINNKVVRTVDDDEYFSDNQHKLLLSLSPETQSLVAQFIYENGEDAFHSFLAVVNPQMQQDLSPEKSDYIVKERKRDVLKRKMSRLVGLHDRQGQF